MIFRFRAATTECSLVDKIIIAQESVEELINVLSPGAYASLTRVDFKTLDRILVNTIGLYGSKSQLVKFLVSISAVNDRLCVLSFIFCCKTMSNVAPEPQTFLHPPIQLVGIKLFALGSTSYGPSPNTSSLLCTGPRIRLGTTPLRLRCAGTESRSSGKCFICLLSRTLMS
jgi:hypothetical protein